MNRVDTLNDAAKWGLLIGIIMGGSRILEYGLMLTGSVSNFAILTFEWVIVGILYAVVLYYAMRVRAEKIYDAVGFSFGVSVNYGLLVSIFASVVVSAMSYIYINSVIGGYDIYVMQLLASITKVVDEAQMDRSMIDMYIQAYGDAKSEGFKEPSIIDTLLTTMSTYILAGALVGVIVSLIIKRKFKIKKDLDNEQHD